MSRQRKRNPVAEAIRRAGGVTKTAVLLEVANQTVHLWRNRRRMPTNTAEARSRAQILSERTGIAVLDLVGFARSHSQAERAA